MARKKHSMKVAAVHHLGKKKHGGKKKGRKSHSKKTITKA